MTALRHPRLPRPAEVANHDRLKSPTESEIGARAGVLWPAHIGIYGPMPWDAYAGVRPWITCASMRCARGCELRSGAICGGRNAVMRRRSGTAPSALVL